MTITDVINHFAPAMDRLSSQEASSVRGAAAVKFGIEQTTLAVHTGQIDVRQNDALFTPLYAATIEKAAALLDDRPALISALEWAFTKPPAARGPITDETPQQ